MKMKKIGVHGESMGGIAVTHLGRNKNVDYICADRTFRSISSVVEISFGETLASLFRMITLWDDRIARDFAESQCYKIITYDPRDEIIHLLSSLKYGVTSHMALEKLGIYDGTPKPHLKESYSLLSPYRLLNMVRKFIQVVRFEFKQKEFIYRLENDKSLLTKSQMLALFWALHRISELFITMSSLNAVNVRKKSKSPKKNNNMGPKMSKNPQPAKAGQGNLSSTGGVRLETQGKEDNSSGSSNNQLEESVSFIPDQILNQSIESGLGQNEHELIKSTEIKSYKEMFDYEAQNSSVVIELLVKVTLK